MPSVTSLPVRAVRALAFAVSAVSAGATLAAAQSPDPRVGLGAGINGAASAAKGLTLVGHVDRQPGWFNPTSPGDLRQWNADLAFRGTLVFQGGFNGIQVWDVADPATPVRRLALACPGGQGDVSVLGTLMFMSVEEGRGRVDCGAQGVADSVSADRFVGVRIFDISTLDQPRQVAAVQTCRGSHTHTLVTKPGVSDRVWVYVQGTSPSRSPSELPGCSRRGAEDPQSAQFRIEVIEVPLARPQDARIVAGPRIFADSAGNIAGLWPGGAHGEGTQETALTDQCHDITAFPARGIAAGACSGNGLLLDIRDPARPVRLAAASDPNFAYWHSATFNDDASTIVFTDEWGGGVSPRCRATDRPQWGANAIFRRDGVRLAMAGYYKLPAPQTAQENCVAHNGTLVPVPGRDIMVQAWYQGGISVFDFTDPAAPVEIAFFDRGPIDAQKLYVGGQWSAYWYNGRIYGSEMARGLDVLELVPSEHLTANEIAAARLVQVPHLNPQHQDPITWPVAFPVARAYVDQLVRGGGLPASRTTAISAALDRAERASGAARSRALRALARRLAADATGAKDAPRVRKLAGVVEGLSRAR